MRVNTIVDLEVYLHNATMDALYVSLDGDRSKRGRLSKEYVDSSETMSRTDNIITVSLPHWYAKGRGLI